MAKGTEAKNYINTKLKTVFGADYLGEMGGKIYINAPEGGSKVQIAISMTCPKTPYAAAAESAFDMVGVVPTPQERAVVTEEEQAHIKSLLEELGF